MATHRIPVDIGQPDVGVPIDLVSNQITSAAAPSVGNQLCYVMNDGGADEGFQVKFEIPQNYVGTPVLTVKGIIDGAPGASDTLGFGLRKRAVANNEAADGTYDAEQVASATIGSNGSGHSDEDHLEQTITLTAGDYSVGDTVFGYVFIDASGTSYTGNFLCTDVLFTFADV